MIHNERELFSKLEDLRLSETKRVLIRSELVAFADLHTVSPKEERARFNSVVFLGHIFANSRRLMAASLVLVLILGTGTATTYASERAVPGELLYGVKVNVAEPVASVFAGEGVSQARFHAKLALRRVQEAEELESRGQLNAKHAEELSTRFTFSADRAEKEALKLASSGDYSASLEVRTELAAELSTHLDDIDSEDTSAAGVALVATEIVDTEAVATSRVAMKAIEEPMVAAEPLELATGEVSLKPFKELISRKIVSLRVNTNPRADLHEKFATDEVEKMASGDTPKVKQVSAARALLLGASVAENEKEELNTTSKATTSEASLDGAEIIKEILKGKRARQQATTTNSVETSTEADEPEATKTEGTKSTSLIDAVKSVTNSIVPSSGSGSSGTSGSTGVGSILP